MTHTRLPALALGGVLLLVGCGGGETKTVAATTSIVSTIAPTTTTALTTTTLSTASSVRTSAPACALLTPLDIKAALQVAVGPGTGSEQATFPACTFTTADGATTILVVRHDPLGDLIKTTLASDPKAKALGGVGDEAVDQIGMGQVTMGFRGVGVVIRVMPAPSLAALVQLARVAGGKL
jgi:hypothetical protein